MDRNNQAPEFCPPPPCLHRIISAFFQPFQPQRLQVLVPVPVYSSLPAWEQALPVSVPVFCSQPGTKPCLCLFLSFAANLGPSPACVYSCLFQPTWDQALPVSIPVFSSLPGTKPCLCPFLSFPAYLGKIPACARSLSFPAYLGPSSSCARFCLFQPIWDQALPVSVPVFSSLPGTKPCVRSCLFQPTWEKSLPVLVPCLFQHTWDQVLLVPVSVFSSLSGTKPCLCPFLSFQAHPATNPCLWSVPAYMGTRTPCVRSCLFQPIWDQALPVSVPCLFQPTCDQALPSS
jgi:hypothetical protein